MKRAPALLALTLATTLLASGCGGGEDALVVYNAQHEELMTDVAKAFTEETGIEVELRNGKDLEMSAQLVAEGDASPADVFLTENSPAMAQVEQAGLFTELPDAAVADIPAQYRPRTGLWTGFVARSTVLVYNTDLVSEDELPDSILDLADPEWRGRISFSPTGADFQAIVAALLDLEGEPATRAWLEGIKANYYWYRDQAESGDVSDNSELYYFGEQDPGAFVSVSGAGILASSDHRAEAEKFVSYLTSTAGQQQLADSYALEYPLNPAVRLDPPVKPFSELAPPQVNVSDLDGEAVVDLMTEVGFL